jgi:branched-subunit amino acid transport protein
VNIYMSLVTAGIILATFTTRATLLLVPRFKLSPRVEAALRFAPVCALAVLVVPAVVVQEGAVNLSFFNPRLVAALAATAFFLWTRSMVACIAVGMLVATAFRFF